MRMSAAISCVKIHRMTVLIRNKKSEIRNKNDEQVSGISSQGSEHEERIEEQGPRTEENEEVRMKNEEQGSVISGQGSVNEEERMTKEEKLPPCLEIMKRVMERSREEDDGSLTFTIEEMECLAGDPLFARLDPRMAADIRKILEEGPPD